MHRRASDKCIIKRLYETLTPYPQLIGYFIMLGTILGALYVAFTFIAQANANTENITQLLQFKDTTGTAIAVIQQEVHDIHEVVMKAK